MQSLNVSKLNFNVRNVVELETVKLKSDELSLSKNIFE